MPQNTFGVNSSFPAAIQEALERIAAFQETLTATTSATSAPAACFWQPTLAT